VTTASNGVQLEGGGAQEDDQQQVEDGAQEGAAEVGGDAVVGGDQRVVQHIVRVALIHEEHSGDGKEGNNCDTSSLVVAP